MFALTVLQSQQHVLVCAALIYVYALYFLHAAHRVQTHTKGDVLQRGPVGCQNSYKCELAMLVPQTVHALHAA